LRDAQARIQQFGNEKARLQADFHLQQQNLQTTRERLAELDSSFAARTRAVHELRQARARAEQTIAQTEQRLANLRGDYDTLKVKYDRLIRPARSPQGKHVVEVRYDKGAQGYEIGFRESRDEGFAQLSRETLERRLTELKAQYGRDLYVRIIIPDDSGLLYNEAWSFTNEILSRYDYYYQAAARAPGAEAIR
jgi:chromosome segregation ATPase